jgi:chemotaxis protein methyltransferase CheR
MMKTSIDTESTAPRLRESEYQRFRELIESLFGIALGNEKREMMQTRLRGLLVERGYGDYGQLYEEFADHTNVGRLFDEISTNHTYFFRESAHFDFLSKTTLPERVACKSGRNETDLRVWCAASSTGEEAYVLAMLIEAALGEDAPRWRAGVLATDLNASVLEHAREGIYSHENVAGLPSDLQRRYFEEHESGGLQVIRELREQVVLRRFNLMHRFPFRGRFDVVFCRNVMIYFTAETQRDLVARIHAILEPGGYLFVGLSEALDRSTTALQFVGPGIYRKSEAS